MIQSLIDEAALKTRERDLLEAEVERQVADSPEAQALMEEIDKAVRAYSDFLNDHGLIWSEDSSDDFPKLKAQALVATFDYGEGYYAVDIKLKDGALDRVYGESMWRALPIFQVV